MKKISLKEEQISTWDKFHNTFSELLGFPEWYGRNLDAWIDCMTYLDDDEGNITQFQLSSEELLIIEIEDAAKYKGEQKEILEALIDCSAFVNYRRIDIGQRPIIILSYMK